LNEDEEAKEFSEKDDNDRANTMGNIDSNAKKYMLARSHGQYNILLPLASTLSEARRDTKVAAVIIKRPPSQPPDEKDENTFRDSASHHD